MIGKIMFIGYILHYIQILNNNVGVVLNFIQTAAEFWEQYSHDSTIDVENFGRHVANKSSRVQ